MAGTFGYMAPEQFAGDASPRSDLYGLGALAVALLTRKDPATLAGNDRRVRWRDHATVSRPTGALLDALLAIQPADRPPSAAAVAQRIDRICALPPPRTARATPPKPPARPRGTSLPSVIVWGAATGSALLVAGAAIVAAFGLAVGLLLLDPVGSDRAPKAAPRWKLELPAGLPPEEVGSLFEKGKYKLRQDDPRGALQDFYRISAAHPDHAHITKFALVAGERLILDGLEDRFLADATERGRPIRPPSPPVDRAAAHDLTQRGEVAMRAGRYDEASRSFRGALDQTGDRAERVVLVDKLRKAQRAVARTSAGQWRKAVAAEVAGDKAAAKRELLELRLAHPTNPSASPHLDRIR